MKAFRLFLFFLFSFFVLVLNSNATFQDTAIEGKIICEYAPDGNNQTNLFITYSNSGSSRDSAVFRIYTSSFYGFVWKVFELSNGMSNEQIQSQFDQNGVPFLVYEDNNLDLINSSTAQSIFNRLKLGRCPNFATNGIYEIPQQSSSDLDGIENRYDYYQSAVFNGASGERINQYAGLSYDISVADIDSSILCSNDCYVGFDSPDFSGHLTTLFAEQNCVNKNYFSDNANLYSYSYNSILQTSVPEMPGATVKCAYKKKNLSDGSSTQVFIARTGNSKADYKYWYYLKVHDKTSSCIGDFCDNTVLNGPIEINKYTSGILYNPTISPSFYFKGVYRTSSLTSSQRNYMLESYNNLVSSDTCPYNAVYKNTGNNSGLIGGTTVFDDLSASDSDDSLVMTLDRANKYDFSDIVGGATSIEKFQLAGPRQELVNIQCPFSFCESAGILRSLNSFNKVISIVKIIIPLILIIIGCIDLGKEILNGDADSFKKAVSTFIKKAIAALIIFLVPTLVNFFIKTFTKDDFSQGSYIPCNVCLTDSVDGAGRNCDDYIYNSKLRVCQKLVNKAPDLKPFFGCKYADDYKYGQYSIVFGENDTIEVIRIRSDNSMVTYILDEDASGDAVLRVKNEVGYFTVELDSSGGEGITKSRLIEQLKISCPTAIQPIPINDTGAVSGLIFEYNNNGGTNEGVNIPLVCGTDQNEC